MYTCISYIVCVFIIKVIANIVDFRCYHKCGFSNKLILKDIRSIPFFLHNIQIIQI